MEKDEQINTKPLYNGVGLKEFFTLWINNLERLVDERCKRIDERFTATEKARELALDAMEKRLDTLNEIREALRDQNNTFFTKEAHQIFCDKIEGEIRPLEDFKLLLDTKASSKQLAWAYAISGCSLALALAAIITRIIVK